MSKEMFEAYVEHALLPTLRAWRAVLLDSLNAREDERGRVLVEAKAVRFCTCRLTDPA